MVFCPSMPSTSRLSEREYSEYRVGRVDLLVFEVCVNRFANNLLHRLSRVGGELPEEPVLPLRDLSLNQRHTTYYIRNAA